MRTKLFLAYQLLYTTYAVLPIAAGIDKFFYSLAPWHIYINNAIPSFLNMSMQSFIQYMGLTEILIGLLVFWKPTIGASVVTLGLVAIALSIISTGHHYDVAVRDIVMAVGSFSLVLLSQQLSHGHNK